MYRVCFNCKSDKTHIEKDGYAHWRSNNNQWYCNNCYYRLFVNQKHHNSRRMKWTPSGKQIYLKENPRIGICKNCGEIRRTEIHHINYHEDDPLRDTMELCVPCHRRIVV